MDMLATDGWQDPSVGRPTTLLKGLVIGLCQTSLESLNYD